MEVLGLGNYSINCPKYATCNIRFEYAFWHTNISDAFYTLQFINKLDI